MSYNYKRFDCRSTKRVIQVFVRITEKNSLKTRPCPVFVCLFIGDNQFFCPIEVLIKKLDFEFLRGQ